MPKKWITVTQEPGKKKRKKKEKRSLWFCNRVVYMHISWFSHISHTTERPWRPKPLLKGLSSKAGGKITRRLRVLSRAGLLTVTRLLCVPQAVSLWARHTNWPQHDSPALQCRCFRLCVCVCSRVCEELSDVLVREKKCENISKGTLLFCFFFKPVDGNDVPNIKIKKLEVALNALFWWQQEKIELICSSSGLELGPRLHLQPFQCRSDSFTKVLRWEV